MRRDAGTNRAAGLVRGRDKLYEYSSKDADLIPLPQDFFPSKLFPIAVGFLGDFAAERVSSFCEVRAHSQTSIDDVAFSAKTLLAYANARIDEDIRKDLMLLSGAAFHLIDMPGVSWVQASRLAKDYTGSYIEQTLIWLLLKPWAQEPPFKNELLEVANLVRALRKHYRSGIARSEIADNLISLRRISYASYDAHALLIAELLSAVVVFRFENSSRTLLHKFARTEPDAWISYLQADSAIHELWPSQRKLGEAGVLAGASATVQMPTSAGKTKATEIILRTAFTANRARLAVVVAPFVALCDEIHEALRSALAIDSVSVNRLGDAIQIDYSDSLWEGPDVQNTPNPQVVVITPEKLLYVLRQNPEIASRIDLLIYDEGHQFDSGARGVTYELLLTSIKGRIGKSAQTLLISAVIQNAPVVSKWLLGSESSVVVDTSNQTQRSIGFTSKNSDGQIYFVPNSESEPAFAVPGVLLSEQLRKKPREKARTFPVQGDKKSVALYLGLRLVDNGGVAIFCGKKDSASALLKYALDVFSRGTSMPAPAIFCDEAELSRFVSLYKINFGDSSYLTEASKLGIFSHTSSTPRGVRAAIEYSMRERLISFIVCTSTLAQGVNLPIKYLLVTGTQQGKDSIRIRDFKNLMGRAGRAGMHEEGTIIFCDTKIFDEKRTPSGSRRWQVANDLINPNSEDPVGSSLLQLVLPFKDKFGGSVSAFPPVDIAIYLISSLDSVREITNQLKGSLSRYKLDESGLRAQLIGRLELLKRLQSHVMASAIDVPEGQTLQASALAAETLAYHLANDTQRADLVRLFEGVSASISEAVPDQLSQIRFGKSLLGVSVSLRVDAWVEERITRIVECTDTAELARTLWPLFISSVTTHRLYECDPSDAVEDLFYFWLAGKSYEVLLTEICRLQATHPWGDGARRSYTIDDVVEICEILFGFEIPLIVAAVKASAISHSGDNPRTRRFSYLADALQKQIKYGLPNQNCVAIFEAGFSDRVVAQLVERAVWGRLTNAQSVGIAIRDWQADVEDVLSDFPKYFRSVFLRIIAE